MKPILDPSSFAPLSDAFSRAEPEGVVNLIPDAQAADWMAANCPRFDCPDDEIREVYAYRWWSFRKHIKQTPAGRIVTEFILPVSHAARYNAISCALGHHVAEGRWLADQAFLDEYVNFWFTANDGKPEPKFHAYSSWLHAALVDRAAVTGDWTFVENLLDALIADYETWQHDRRIESGPYAGLYWQYDVRDGMEESITGSRKHKNARPTISSYMFANARAIAFIAKRLGRQDVAERFEGEAETLRRLVDDKLWDADAKFFKAVAEETHLSDAREAIGFVPWQFGLPVSGTEDAWQQLIDPRGFWGPAGIATAERRHPKFRTHGVGRCEWDGAAWPFATSQTIDGLANVLRGYQQAFVTKQTLLDALHVYARCHRKNGHRYLGEYHDETTGEWLKGDNPRSQFYNHSTFCDLVLHHLVGIVPHADGHAIEIDPLVPAGAWAYFCADGVRYHGRQLSVIWDQTGARYQRGAGLTVLLENQPIGHRADLGKLVCPME